MKNKKIKFAVLLTMTLVLFAWHTEVANAAPLSDEAFILLVETGTPQEVEAAIRAGANANARNHEGSTALMAALGWWVSYPEVIVTLLQNGADINARDNWGNTPLMVASSGRNPDALSVLLENGADINARDSSGRTALILAAAPYRYGLEMFLERGADVNARSDNGLTALMLSVMYHSSYYNSTEEIILLLESGADAAARNSEGRRAIDYARNNPRLANTDAFRRLEAASR